MTGIVILPAGRDDAFEDYKRFVRDGHPIGDIESDLDEGLVHARGTSVDGTWRNVEEAIDGGYFEDDDAFRSVIDRIREHEGISVGDFYGTWLLEYEDVEYLTDAEW